MVSSHKSNRPRPDAATEIPALENSGAGRASLPPPSGKGAGHAAGADGRSFADVARTAAPKPGAPAEPDVIDVELETAETGRNSGQNAGARAYVRDNAFRTNPPPRNSARGYRLGMTACGLLLAAGFGWIAGANTFNAPASGDANVAMAGDRQNAPAKHPGASPSRIRAAETLPGTDDRLKALEASLRALHKRLGGMDGAGKTAGEISTIKAALENLSGQIKSSGVVNASAISELVRRLDRATQKIAKRNAALEQRIVRLEKQLADRTPVGSIARAPKEEGTKVAKAVATATPKSSGPKGADEGNVTKVARAKPVPLPPPPPASLRKKTAANKAIPLNGYVLRDVYDGAALVEGRRGFIEIVPGMRLPGAGRVRSIRRQGGRWVVVTTRGIIDSRPY